MKFIFLMFCAANAGALSTVQEKSAAQTLYPQIRATAKSSRVSCVDEICTITWEEFANKRVSFIDVRAQRLTRTVRLKSLAQKWKDGAISAQEKDELLKELVFDQLGL
jgi:hypothetical protein